MKREKSIADLLAKEDTLDDLYAPILTIVQLAYYLEKNPSILTKKTVQKLEELRTFLFQEDKGTIKGVGLTAHYKGENLKEVFNFLECHKKNYANILKKHKRVLLKEPAKFSRESMEAEVKNYFGPLYKQGKPGIALAPSRSELLGIEPSKYARNTITAKFTAYSGETYKNEKKHTKKYLQEVYPIDDPVSPLISLIKHTGQFSPGAIEKVEKILAKDFLTNKE